MAKAKLDFPDELYKQLAQLEKATDTVIEEMLHVGGKLLVRDYKTAIQFSTNPDLSTGELKDSIKYTIKYDNRAVPQYAYVRPHGARRNVSDAEKKGIVSRKTGKLYNSDIAYFHEYGTSKQKARPVLKKVEKRSKESVERRMRMKFEEEVKKYVHDK